MPIPLRRSRVRRLRGSAFLASYAFVGEPEANDVIERFFRTLKEQVVHGQIYQTVEEVRDAVRDFIARYNAECLIEKNGLRSPCDTRAAWYQTIMKVAALQQYCVQETGAVHAE